MSRFVAYLTLAILCLSPGPGSVIIINGQRQMIDAQILDGGDDGQCAPMEEREGARNEIHQIANSAILATICNGTPGWRRVAFINMTDTSYNCPTGLNLTSYSKRTCGRSHTTPGGCSSTTFSVGGLRYSRVCGRIRGYQFGATSGFWAYVNRNQVGIDTSYLPEICPCDTHNYDGVPAFVGDDFFC